MILSICLGASLYALVQLLWYSPLLMGKRWREMRAVQLDIGAPSSLDGEMHPTTFTNVIVPALLMSLAFHALSVVLASLGAGVLILSTVLLCGATASPKYLRWNRLSSLERSYAYFNDGALVLSMALLLLYILWAQGTVY